MVSSEHKIILLLPPKTGSNSIISCFNDSNIIFDEPVIPPNIPYNHLTLSEIMFLHNIRKNDLNNYKIIQITRNPYDRIISAWKHHNTEPTYKINLGELVKKLNKIHHFLPFQCDSFYENFYGSIKRKLHSFKNNNWGGIRFWYLQNWWNDINANVTYFKLEDLTTDNLMLSKFININLVPLPHIRPQDTLRNIDYKEYFSDEIKNIIDDIYKIDINKFNYTF